MCGAPLRIFRPTSLWPSLSLPFPLTLSRTLSSSYVSLFLLRPLSSSPFLHLCLSLFRFQISSPSLFLVLPFPFPSSPPPAPCSYKHSALFAFAHNRHENGVRADDGECLPKTQWRKGGGCRTSERKAMMFIAWRPVRECNVCPCVPDLLRAIKLFFFYLSFDSLSLSRVSCPPPFLSLFVATERSSRRVHESHTDLS